MVRELPWWERERGILMVGKDGDGDLCAIRLVPGVRQKWHFVVEDDGRISSFGFNSFEAVLRAWDTNGVVEF